LRQPCYCAARSCDPLQRSARDRQAAHRAGNIVLKKLVVICDQANQQLPCADVDRAAEELIRVLDQRRVDAPCGRDLCREELVAVLDARRFDQARNVNGEELVGVGDEIGLDLERDGGAVERILVDDERDSELAFIEPPRPAPRRGPRVTPGIRHGAGPHSVPGRPSPATSVSFTYWTFASTAPASVKVSSSVLALMASTLLSIVPSCVSRLADARPTAARTPDASRSLNPVIPVPLASTMLVPAVRRRVVTDQTASKAPEANFAAVRAPEAIFASVIAPSMSTLAEATAVPPHCTVSTCRLSDPATRLS